MSIDRERVLQAAQKYVEKKKYDKAILEYQKIIQEDPNDARTLLKIGDLQLKMEAYAEAIATYERVGRYYSAQGFSLKAIAVYKQIREIINKHVPQLVERYAHISPKLAELYQQLGLTSDALAALDEVAQRLQRQQRDSEAIDVFRKIVELDPTNPLPHLRLAEALSRARDSDGAATEFGIAATQLVKHGRRDDALKVIERLLHHRQDMQQARAAAELYLARNQPNDGMQALAKLQICFQANPKDLDTLALLARAFGAIGQASKGVEVHKEMARIARDQGKLDLFRELVEKLQRTAPNDEGVRALIAGTEGRRASAAPPPPPPPPPPSQHVHAAGRVPPPPPPPRAHPPVPPRVERAAPPPQGREVSSVLDESDLVSVVEVYPAEEEGRTFEPPPESIPAADGGPGDIQIDDDEAAAQALQQELRTLLEEAQASREGGNHDDAIERLRLALEIEPRSQEARGALRDVLLDVGLVEDAVEEMLTIASLQLDELDGEGAARTLHDVLAVDPSNDRARQTLRELGYDVPTIAPPPPAPAGELELVGEVDPYPVDVAEGYIGSPHGYVREPEGADFTEEPLPSYGEDPLPSYELEEVGPADEPVTTYSRPPEARAIAMMDDPFADASDEHAGAALNAAYARGPAAAEPATRVPLPSYPVEAESEAELFDLVPPGGHAAAPRASFADQGTADAIEAVAPLSPHAPRNPNALEDALEEADFFASRGLFDDARAVLNEQLSIHPNHRLLHERVLELEAHERSNGQASGTRALPSDEDRSFDIAASLDALESFDESAALPAEGNKLVEGQIDVEEVFAKFKEGVQKQISVDDSQAHYDLGVAYKEMGLLDDAVRELDIAARDARKTCICESMIGMIQMERGLINEAIDAYLRGLHATLRVPEQETALSFELGGAYEAKKMFKDALGYYQRVARREPNYRDVQDRIRRLHRQEPVSPVRAAAVGDDEFDRAFDEIIGSGPNKL